jgi:hypothetical protein
VRRLVAVVVGGIGLGALWRRRRGRHTPVASPADELREKLAESRAAETAPPVDDVDARRREVHEEARRSIDELA